MRPLAYMQFRGARTGDFLVYFWNILILDNSHDDDITVYEAPLQGGMRCGVTVQRVGLTL